MYARVGARFENALTPISVLSAWIAKAHDGRDRQMRQGVGFSLTGKVIEPAAGFDAKRATDDEIARRSQSMLRF
ncbi:MAG: hypothetical protein IH587_09145 [Anaerolineae bacterium]|nr:hypothetical protein [Anaerolineae bacterium]